MKNFFKKLMSSKSQSKYFSETVQRVGKNNAGFSLVELIVVIAIMAILAAVAVIGVSIYIPKAQKAADEQTVSDIMDAFDLYYYSDPDGVTGGYVVLGPNGVVDADDFGAEVMEAVYGANWETAVKLQYADWKGVTSTVSYAGTSYHGNEKDLLKEVDRLTGALGSAVKEYNINLGTGFTDFLGGYGLDNSASEAEIGNAAVLYVAQQTAGNGDFIKETMVKHINANPANPDLNGAYNELQPKIGSAAALAAIYAYAEGFAQYCDQQDSTLDATKQFHEAADFDGTKNASDALQALTVAFGKLGQVGGAHLGAYLADNGPGEKDLDGYVEIMGTVNDNKDVVDDNLSADDCFTDGKVENILNGFASMGGMNVSTKDGEIAIMFVIEEGVPTFHTLPLDLIK